MTVSKFYIRYRENFPETEMAAIAEFGFRQRGTAVSPFYGFGDIQTLSDLGPAVGIAGYLGDVWEALSKLGLPKPASLDYPDELSEFLGRKIEKISLSEAKNITHRQWFIKPVEQKLFTGFLCTGSFQDQIKLAGINDTDNHEIWLSEPVNFISEYRCFILNHEIIGVKWYKGDWGQAIDRKTVENAVKAYQNSPIAYSLDFGKTDDGKTLLVEVNDSYALGSYGLQPELYAAMLEARWEELTK